jgi:hypothetical protein
MTARATVELGSYPWIVRGIGLVIVGLCLWWAVICASGATISVGSKNHRHNRTATMADACMAIPALLIGGLIAGFRYHRILDGQGRRLVSTTGWGWMLWRSERDIADWRRIQVGPGEKRQGSKQSYWVIPVRGMGAGSAVEVGTEQDAVRARALGARVAEAMGLPLDDLGEGMKV